MFESMYVKLENRQKQSRVFEVRFVIPLVGLGLLPGMGPKGVFWVLEVFAVWNWVGLYESIQM